ncbi:enoyl-CoA hydratase/isomerase family protein [Calidifontibacillus erzurumensis]|uniref:Ethylmalonyl-CoA decarboxylase n=1 Tax=Calidifontibacillus erzurumensis TaxID=2741433 RepID=A0A8J8GEH2_9BACI|nr:enoyl-CoA hydratase/isomerase family protein [Calidifontibacillus erzurumensis]NSL50765.1 enoyl-CoA hydratase/isomerase family protein [Calidifontibacillus erzurumensis]
MGKVLVERDEKGIVWLTINRMEKRNAIDYEVMDIFKATIDEVAANKDDKVLVITGAGNRAFCSGGDLSVFHNLHTKDEAYAMLSKMGEILYSLMTLPKPTVALLNGTAIGGGCEVATACDFRLANENVKFGFVQGKLGITTGWGGASMLFEKLPYDKAMTLLMTAKQYSAREGYELGFIHKLFDENEIREQCEAYLAPYLSQSTGVLEAYKNAAIRKWKEVNLRERMFLEIEQCAVLWESDEHHEAVKAFLENK